MTEVNQPTLETLQAELIALKDKQNENESRITALSEENKKLSDDLNKARELNTKLFLRIPSGENSGNTDQNTQEEDSFDKLLDDVFDKYVTKKKETT